MKDMPKFPRRNSIVRLTEDVATCEQQAGPSGPKPALFNVEAINRRTGEVVLAQAMRCEHCECFTGKVVPYPVTVPLSAVEDSRCAR